MSVFNLLYRNSFEHYSRIQSDGINPLVKEAFNINKNISNENIYTWYTFVTDIFKEVELNKNNF
jgi:hypothetical protein